MKREEARLRNHLNGLSKETLIDLLMQIKFERDLMTDMCNNLAKEALQMAIEAVEKQATSDYASEWIPCSERLPDDDVDVFVWFEYFRYGEYNGLFQTRGISYTHNGEWSGFVNGESGWCALRIIAWTPLPEPFQEEELK